ncbi:hypothetical protein ELI49_17770 [Rhizobium ruizarguesonis]|nr:hypothetical protein ELI49_17770 [Rhizobium ruizarguesonis]TAX16045.1 hypothetical protein ELI09_18720 [Rhizobium ruizarguesonis]TAX20876.1 hypothetical protein ELI08_18735 [Rhizobium ruizarguesonis]
MKASHFRRLHRAILRFKNRRGSNRCLMKVSVAGQLASGELDTQQKRKKLLDAYAEELSVKRLAWANIQVSLIVGAGFVLFGS